MVKQDGAFLVLFKDDSRKEVFMVYRTDYPIWVLSGGGVEAGEDPQSAAIREAYEETGFEVKLVRFVGVYRNLLGGKVVKNTYLYEGRVVGGTYKPEFEGNIGKWFPVNKLPLDITSTTKVKIQDILSPTDKQFDKTIDSQLPLLQNLPLIIRHPIAFLKYIGYRK